MQLSDCFVIFDRKMSRNATPQGPSASPNACMRPFRAPIHAVGESGGYLLVSIGGAQYGQDEGARALVRRADQALYRAKRQGKNCVCLDGLA